MENRFYYYLTVILISITAVFSMNYFLPELNPANVKWWVILLTPTILFALLVKTKTK